MIARAALGKPWLFRQVQAALRGEPIPPDPTLEEERELLLHHFDLVCRRFGTDRGTNPDAQVRLLLRPRAAGRSRLSRGGGQDRRARRFL